MVRDLSRIHNIVDQIVNEYGHEFRRRDNKIIVNIGHVNRTQTVLLGRKKDCLTLSSVVYKLNGKRSKNMETQQVIRRVWNRNSLIPIVSLSIDSRQWIVGKISLLYENVNEQNLVFYCRTLARECDRFESMFSLTDEN